VFYRGTHINVGTAARKRVAISVPAAACSTSSLVLLAYSGISRDNTTLLEMDAVKAYQDLENGQLDVAFFIGRPVLHAANATDSDLEADKFAQAGRPGAKFPYLSKNYFSARVDQHCQQSSAG